MFAAAADDSTIRRQEELIAKERPTAAVGPIQSGQENRTSMADKKRPTQLQGDKKLPKSHGKQRNKLRNSRNSKRPQKDYRPANTKTAKACSKEEQGLKWPSKTPKSGHQIRRRYPGRKQTPLRGFRH